MEKTNQEKALMERVEDKSVLGQVRIGKSWVAIQRRQKQFRVDPMGGKRYFLKWSDENIFDKIAKIA